MSKLKPILFGTAFALVAGPALAQEEQFITIGTGGQTGVYYVVGQSICRLVNRETAETGLRCTAPATGGSIDNINQIKSGGMTMGVAQSDWQYHAYNGSSDFEGDAFDKLRSVFSVHSEPFTVVARADSGIETFEDLAGKRVNVGNPGSGTRGTFEVVLDTMGMSMDDFSLSSELRPAEQSAALGDNQVDAISYTVGHPNGSIQEATSTVDARLVSVTGDAIDALIEENPYYAKAVIPGGMYAGNDEDTETFGVKATFVTSEDIPEETVYQVVKAVFDNFDRFKGLHPAFANLTPEEMVADGNSAPLHPGAERYYREQGWVE
ncbi:TAXI family TRAP transporter solute-binding subunit [Paracoccus sp. 1_MG-2023]|uniref:TAXI family TRAP transporter solute-binding subunit n=1 Tax=unclassified Paracoccus (in: a-proteobacteria) TaxID=2688777 RepID=UPI001C09F3EA|nr:MULTISPECIES: TAXI family TRAP transporter solute-binding subunit [unclassified Paracoccus (in: a-proteobacteria)]MBU2956531.1 TAXI family TRAP transporter solute-binding subunit [Paracoccus sp. C2R09]MDO6670415.1 TAXI family TRAP transporter solute-binding subunit [Paracoccus sp. 1_MG-2023]